MKSTKITLVLITAALASCNRTLVPEQQFIGPTGDSTLIVAPSYYDSLYNNSFLPCYCEANDYRLWNYSFIPNILYQVPPPINGNYYFPNHRQNRILAWRADNFIVRGGFGGSAHYAGS